MNASELPLETIDTPLPNATTPDEEDPRRRRKILVLLFMLVALVLLVGLAIWYLVFRQPVPLPIIPETQVPHYTNTLYGTARPVGIALNASGDRIYVAQTGPGSAWGVVMDTNGKILSEMLPPKSTGDSHVPVWMAVSPTTGDVYVSDRPTGSIYIYDANGSYQRQFQPDPERPGWEPMGLAFDKEGNLYVSDLGSATQQVAEFDGQGKLVATFGASDSLNFPNGIAVDGSGNVYVVDSNNGRLLVYDPKGLQVTRIGRGAGTGNLGLPRGVTLDASGRLFVADSSGQDVVVYRQYEAGQTHLAYLGQFGTQGVGEGQFMFPNGVTADGHGRLFVSDTSNDRIQIWGY